VTFANRSTPLYGTTGYTWTFGDGATSAITDPTHVYTTPGVYTVSLSVAVGDESATLARTHYVTVGGTKPPAADFTAQPVSGTAPLTVTFTNLSQHASSYDWAFGDGSMLLTTGGETSAETDPVHVYGTVGVYTVTLTATGPGGSDIKTDTITVSEAVEPPVADFTAQPVSGTAPLMVTFTNLSQHASSYDWAFGDGETSAETDPVHVYGTAGVYTVTLTATGPGGSDVHTRARYVTVSGSGPVTSTRVISYTYDPLGRLTAADYSTGERYAYAYDAVGNRTAMTTTLGATSVTTYTYDAANRLTKVGNVVYTWDARGNLTNDGVFTYTYNSAGRLVRAESLTATLLYTYTSATLSASTADGLRVAQSVDGVETTFAWDLAAGLAQVLATGDGARDVYGLGRIAEVRGGAWAYPLGDALGSVRQWTDDAGNVTYAAGYAPYGEMLWQAGDTESAWGFTGEWWDSYAELLYLRARWYDSGVGRFTQPDPWPGGPQQPLSLHAYIYGFQNPLKYTDPSGTQPYAPILEALRDKAEDCYNKGDLDCVWWCYWSLAAGGGFFGEPIGKPHASRHLFQFLYKWGDLDWGTESDWVFRSPSVQAEMPSINEDILSSVHAAARGGEMSGHVETIRYPIAADSDTESDLYYAMFRFNVWANADYRAWLLGCKYLVTIAPTYYFADDYDWHEGLPAGGGIPGVGGFKDEWAAALHDHGLALEFQVQGHRDSYFMLLYPHNWLDADRPAPIFALPVSLME